MSPKNQWILGGFLTALLIAGFIMWWNRPPQMGSDEEAFEAVDALFTAVTARNPKLLSQCERRLKACASEGKLTPAASAWLDHVIAEAHSGDWRGSSERLYRFMLAQRRDGDREKKSPMKTAQRRS